MLFLLLRNSSITTLLSVLIVNCLDLGLKTVQSFANFSSLTNAKKVTVSVLYWYEKLSSSLRTKFLERP
mgnify:CR=1 FL=1